MSRARRKLTALDDPLGAPPAPAPPATTTRPPAPVRRRDAHAPDDVQSLFVRVPAAQGESLARAAFELRLHKQEIVAALIARYVETSAEGLDAVLALVNEYKEAG